MNFLTIFKPIYKLSKSSTAPANTVVMVTAPLVSASSPDLGKKKGVCLWRKINKDRSWISLRKRHKIETNILFAYHNELR